MKTTILITVLFHCCKLVDVFELNILHFNDFNCELEETPDEVGGISRIIHYVKTARQAAESGEGPPVLVLVSGNFFGQSIWYSVHRWRIAVDFLNLLQPDAMCLGDHEFDDGVEELQNFLDVLNIPVIGTNLEVEGLLTLKDLIQKSVTLNIAGKKIVILGYTDRGRAVTNAVTFGNQVPILKDYCTKIKKTNVDFVFAIGHSTIATDRRIAMQSDCIQAIIGGGAGILMYNGQPPSHEKASSEYPMIVELSDGSKIPVAYAFRDGLYVGKLSLKFSNKNELQTIKGDTIYMDEKIPQDQASMDILAKYSELLEKMKMHTIGKTLTTLDGSSCNESECSLGNLVLDAFCDFKATQHHGVTWTSAAIAILNSGAIRDSHNISKHGKFVSEAFLYKALPYQTQLMTVRISGKTLLEAIEHSLAAGGGAFIQVAGIQIVYNMSMDPYDLSVMVRCADCQVPTYSPLDENMEYNLVTTKFLVEGGDGFEMLAQNKIWYNTEVLNSLQATMRYIQDYKKVIGQEEGRVVIVKDSLGIKIHPGVSFYILCLLLHLCVL